MHPIDTREWQVGLVGTFEADNYGDRLFPLIAEAELTRRLDRVKLHCFSYGVQTAATWPYPVTSITELPRLAADLDGLLVGKAFSLGLDRVAAPGGGPPPAPARQPPGFWLSPPLTALQRGIPLLWNALAVQYDDLPTWGDPLMELIFSQSSYIAVRDKPSRNALARFVGSDRIIVVPDPAFGVGRLLPELPSLEFDRLRHAYGLTGQYVVIQGVQGMDSSYRFLKRHAKRLGEFHFLTLPIGRMNGDHTALVGADLARLVCLPTPPPPLLLAEIIRRAAGVISPSYHVAITALTAGVPVFTPANLSDGEFPGLTGVEGIYPLPTEHDTDPNSFLERLAMPAISPAVGDALDRLSKHWDRIATTLWGGITDAPVAVGQFWQALPALLEDAVRHRDAAVEALNARSEAIAALDAQHASREQRIAELTRLLGLARAEIAMRDGTIAGFLKSKSWKVTAPLRFVGKRLKDRGFHGRKKDA
jgi:lipopolysaccharide transport system ATP-binding protein